MMNKLTKLIAGWLSVVTIGALSSGCVVPEGDGCGMSLCGCSEDVTMTFEATIQDAAMMPLAGIELLCHGEDTPIAVSDATGAIAFSIETTESPGCGFGRCNNMILHDPAGKRLDVQGTYFSFNGQTLSMP